MIDVLVFLCRWSSPKRKDTTILPTFSHVKMPKKKKIMIYAIFLSYVCPTLIFIYIFCVSSTFKENECPVFFFILNMIEFRRIFNFKYIFTFNCVQSKKVTDTSCILRKKLQKYSIPMPIVYCLVVVVFWV